jgi:ornithine cyclodeaminase/alanine dehydrogenase-like protein (mu-crystallin family)
MGMSLGELPLLDGDGLRACLPMADAIAAVGRAFTEEREVPPRVTLGGSLFMPGRVGAHTGIKVVSTVPGSPAGLVVVFGVDGAPLGLVDGPALTALRTGAATGLATQLLARPDSAVLAMLGAGAMAPDQVAGVRAVRPIERVVIWSRRRERAATLADSLLDEVDVDVVDDPDVAVAGADVVATATPATSPLFDTAAVADGVHLNAARRPAAPGLDRGGRPGRRGRRGRRSPPGTVQRPRRPGRSSRRPGPSPGGQHYRVQERRRRQHGRRRRPGRSGAGRRLMPEGQW